MKIKKGDVVKIISGNDKGKTGKVLVVLPQEGQVIIDGMNIKKKHSKPRSQGKKGELVRIPAPFSISRVMLICAKCGKPTRVGYSLVEGGKRRKCRKCGVEI